MAEHEYKHCPRCQSLFECKTGSILQCQCQAIKLTEEQRDFIAQQYSDCLCSNCLNDMQRDSHP